MSFMEDEKGPDDKRVQSLSEIALLNLEDFEEFWIKLHNESLFKEGFNLLNGIGGDLGQNWTIANLVLILCILNIGFNSSLLKSLDLLL